MLRKKRVQQMVGTNQPMNRCFCCSLDRQFVNHYDTVSVVSAISHPVYISIYEYLFKAGRNIAGSGHIHYIAHRSLSGPTTPEKKKYIFCED